MAALCSHKEAPIPTEPNEQIVQQYKGEKLSANLPYKVEFMIPVEGSKDVKLIAHLASTEIEAA
ncbi:hypothetical protein COCSUDRAFT_55657 [Coccomyxa subellipsoidea C-169]|uniref:Ferredoxin thioredoxin reductase alpha chain domain-containing protein n=1 Tax=Coccomyxa subellipsoidea (strain C-169) TaxID=574566 RepID=I0ZAJ9_COCSC|nr:hypothetical protein COCSUDRAFT_55657 [Coccomyxa subellipsoidea C-169]EIE27668.1 hypothetical protein COCSUDRAFT_55657 [Coccomyxa subellipsoidea C-169]|eukprot:XP_005652212.1 hypothetical protein COCSUDRAFT_55657 [Coccomyxa subellipsoidea C-169]